MTAVLGALLIALSFGGLTVEKNPKAPSAKQVLVYAPQQADHMIYMDLEATIGPTYKLVKSLPKHPAIRDWPEAMKALGPMLDKLDAGLKMVTTQLGFHPVKDLDWVVAWVRYETRGMPEWLVVLRGKLGKDPIGHIAKMVDGKVTQVRGRPALIVGPAVVMRGADGALLVGSHEWVEERSLATWTALRRKPKTLPKAAEKVLKTKPFFAVFSHPTEKTSDRFGAALGRDKDLAIFHALVTGHTYAAVWLTHNSLGWSWTARDKAGAANAKLASEGVISLMRAGHHGARGFVRLLLAVLEVYAPGEPMLARLTKHKKLILSMVLDHTGDGNFKAKVKTAGRNVTVTAGAKTLSQVFPIGAMAPLVVGGAGFFLFRASSPMMEKSPDIKDAPTRRAPTPIAPPPAPKTAPPTDEEEDREAPAEQPGMDVNPNPPVIDPGK